MGNVFINEQFYLAVKISFYTDHYGVYAMLRK